MPGTIDRFAWAMIAGVGYERLMRARDRTERMVEQMVIDRVLVLQAQIDDAKIERMANAIAKRFP